MSDERQPGVDEVGAILDFRRTGGFDPAVLIQPHGLGVPAFTEGVDDGHHLRGAILDALEVVGGQDLERGCAARPDAGGLMEPQRGRQSHAQAGEAARSASGPDARQIPRLDAGAGQELVDHRDQLARRTALGRGQHFEPVPLPDRHADDGRAGVERKQRCHAAQYTGAARG